jgi:hypothetical protein
MYVCHCYTRCLLTIILSSLIIPLSSAPPLLSPCRRPLLSSLCPPLSSLSPSLSLLLSRFLSLTFSNELVQAWIFVGTGPGYGCGLDGSFLAFAAAALKQCHSNTFTFVSVLSHTFLEFSRSKALTDVLMSVPMATIPFEGRFNQVRLGSCVVCSGLEGSKRPPPPPLPPPPPPPPPPHLCAVLWLPQCNSNSKSNNRSSRNSSDSSDSSNRNISDTAWYSEGRYIGPIFKGLIFFTV